MRAAKIFPKTAKPSRPLVADVLAAALFLAGCLGTRGQDKAEALARESALLTLELDDMAELTAAALLKKSKSPDPGLKFVGRCQCHVRTVSEKLPEGGLRERTDTLWFRTANLKSLRYPSLSQVRSVTHKRRIRLGKGGREADISFVTGMGLFVTRSDTTAIWNGRLRGAYAGTAYSQGRIDDLERRLSKRKWQFPAAGKVEVESGESTLSLAWLAGSAKAVRTDRMTGRTTAVTLQEPGVKLASVSAAVRPAP